MSYFILGKNNTSEFLYSLISLCGTPLIYHIGMEDNRNTDLAHAKNSLKIFNKKKDSTVDDALKEPQKRGMSDDVRVTDVD